MEENKKEVLSEAEAPIGIARHLWVIPEYDVHERSRNWYLSVGIMGIVLIALAVWYQNFLGAILVLLVAVIIVTRSYREPIQLRVAIYDNGIMIGEAFYPYGDLKSFWIIYEPPHVKTLYLDFQSQWRPRLPIPFGEMSPLDIRNTLLKYLEEDLSKESEPTSDALARYFRL